MMKSVKTILTWCVIFLGRFRDNRCYTVQSDWTFWPKPCHRLRLEFWQKKISLKSVIANIFYKKVFFPKSANKKVQLWHAFKINPPYSGHIYSGRSKQRGRLETRLIDVKRRETSTNRPRCYKARYIELFSRKQCSKSKLSYFFKFKCRCT